MLSAISDQMRQYLPNCPAYLVNEILSAAQDMYKQKDVTLSDSGSFLYGAGKQLSYDIGAQFRENATVYLIEPEFPQVPEQFNSPDDLKPYMEKLFEAAASASFWPKLPKNGIKMVVDDGTDKLKSVVENCWRKVIDNCKYLSTLGSSAVKACVEQHGDRCEPLSVKTELTYNYYLQGNEVCESLQVNGLSEKVEKCFQPVAELQKLPLLSEICTWDPPKYTASMPKEDQAFFTAVAIGSVFLAYNRFSKQGTCNKVAGVALSAIALGAVSILLTW